MHAYALCYRASYPDSSKKFAVHIDGCSDLGTERGKYAADIETVGEFCRDNADDSEMCELVIGLPMGESVVFGGGAAPVVEVFRKVGGR